MRWGEVTYVRDQIIQKRPTVYLLDEIDLQSYSGVLSPFHGLLPQSNLSSTPSGEPETLCLQRGNGYRGHWGENL